MSFGLQMERHRRALIVRLAGELDHHASDEVRTRIDEAIVRGDVTYLILSLKDLTFMDSSGIGVILGRYKHITGKGGKMVVCDVTKPVQRLFEMSGLFKIVSIEPSEHEALSSLGVVS